MDHVLSCNKVFGDNRLILETPSVDIVSDVFYVPLAENGNWGIYDQTGAAVLNACNLRGPKRLPIRQSLQVILPDAPLVIHDDGLIYCGMIYPHFGHFITTTLSRFWYLAANNARRPPPRLIFHNTVDADVFFRKSYVAEIFGAMGLQPKNFSRFPEPAFIKGTMTIPGPAFQENLLAHSVFASSARLVGERITGPLGPLDKNPLYISKSRLQKGLRGFINEAELEAELAEHGVTIFHPEQSGFADQLAILGRHSRIIGTVGSAFHSLSFLSGDRRVVGLNQTAVLNSNFLILDQAGGHDATYVYPTEVDTARNDSRFQNAYRLRRPKEVARRLLELV